MISALCILSLLTLLVLTDDAAARERDETHSLRLARVCSRHS